MKLPGLKSALLAGVFAIGSSAALAADLPMAPPPVEPAPAYVPTYTWSGFYVGAVAGYGMADTFEFDDEDGEFEFDDSDGFQIGGTVGYNYQIGNFVLGAEGDISYWNVEDNDDGTEATYFGTLRARAGYSFDRFMVYATGGLAFSDIGFEGVEEGDDTKLGWVVGAGVEGMITENLTAKLEYLYTNFDDDFGADAIGDISGQLDVHTVRAGLNYKFTGF